MYTWLPFILYYGLVFFSFATIIIGHILVALCCLDERVPTQIYMYMVVTAL